MGLYLGRKKVASDVCQHHYLQRLTVTKDANEIPESDDKTYAYFRRWIILPFENVFEDDKNTNLIDELTTR